jgi:O-antigen/teichoic acid export membrane protein
MLNAAKRQLQRIMANFDASFAQLIGGTAIALALKALGACLALALNIAIGRMLGAEGAGLYFLALSVATIGAVVSKLGLDNSLLRFVAHGRANDDGNSVHGVFRLAISSAAIASITAMVAVFLLAPWLAEEALGEAAAAPIIQVMSIGILTFAMMTLMAESLKGLSRIAYSMLVSGTLYPAIALAALWPLVGRFGVAGAATAYVVGTGTAAFIGWMMWRAHSSKIDAPNPGFDRQTLIESCGPLWAMSIINRGILPWAPLLLLGVWGTTEEVGVFGAAVRIATLIAFFLTAANSVLAPKFVELHSKGDIAGLGRLTRNFAMFMTLATSPFFIVLIVMNQTIMGLFGSEFAIGGTALMILAMGQAVNTMTGSVGNLLMMTGHERDIRNTSVFGGALTVGLSLLLIPLYGFIGAAIATASSVAAMNVISVLLIKKRLGINVMPWARS